MGQEPITLASPDVDEEEARAAYDTVLSGRLSQGPAVARFERAFAEYTQVRHAVAFFNGTVALHALLLACDIGPGDEVIVPSLTFVSTATSVLHAGATVIFADIQPGTYTIGPLDVERKLTPATRAIIPVHYAGQAADLQPLLDLAARHDLKLLEDAAQAHGATYHGRMVGGIGHAAMFSFTPTKNITCGEGGMLTTNDDELARRLRLLRNHGMDAPYHHVALGYNYRMTEVQAAIGRVQLGKLERILERKRRIVAAIRAGLSEAPGITLPTESPDSRHPYMIFTILVDPLVAGIDRDQLAATLARQRIETKVYFPPVHQQPIFAATHGHANLPVTEALAPRMLSLPCHSRLTEGQIARMVAAIRDAVGQAA